MTEKRCTDCKYTEGIGYDFWCGEGHTEYEVFGAETNCPYFEYHDWNKGISSMTEKRFELRLCSNGTYYVYENGTLTDIDFDKFNKESADALIDEVNALYDENENLKEENKKLKRELDDVDDCLTRDDIRTLKATRGFVL